MSLAEVSKLSGLNKTTAHRLLRALRSEGLIERNSVTAAYCLGAGLMALGVQALASSDLRRRVRPLLRSLANDTGETATLEVPIEDSMLILDEVTGREVTGRHVIGAAGNVGTRWPLHATSTGKAVLAFDDHGLDRLPENLTALTARTLVNRESFQPEFIDIRRRGYAVTVDELEDGFTAVATVIRTPMGDVQGALSIGGPTQRLTSNRRAELGASLCRAASMLSP
jgi:DNA-binding IclR family transcriptional regulator